MQLKTFMTAVALAGAGVFAAGAAHAQDFNSDFDRAANDHGEASHGVMVSLHAPLGVFHSAKAAAPRLSFDLVNSNSVDQSYVSLASYSFAKGPVSARFNSPLVLRAADGGYHWTEDTWLAVGGGVILVALLLRDPHTSSPQET